MPAILDLKEIGKLPLFAQALIASRMARRAILYLPQDLPAKDRQAMLHICDALDHAATTGGGIEKAINPLSDQIHAFRVGEAGEALYWAWDALCAANAAYDFPVDATCSRDVQNALGAASRAHGLSPLQIRIFAAADLDSLRFACSEAHIGFYDALGPQVMSRLAPVYPPDEQ